MLMVICGLLQLLSDVDEVSLLSDVDEVSLLADVDEVSLLADVSESCETRHAKTKKICISKKSV